MSVEILRDLLRKSSGAEPYRDYIENYLAKDFASEVGRQLTKANEENVDLRGFLDRHRVQIAKLSAATEEGCCLNVGRIWGNSTVKTIDRLLTPKKEEQGR